MVHVNSNVVISMENGSNPHKAPNTQPFSFISVAMICNTIKKFQIGAVGDLV
jgi:hypothetical protein